MRNSLNSMGSYYLPNSGISLLASGALLAILVVWIFLDARFPYALELGMIDLRLSPHPGFKQSIMDEAHAEVRWRLVFLGTISFLVASSTLWTLVRLFIGRPSGRSIAAMLMATALIGAWFCLFTQYERLIDSGARWRIKRQLPELKSLATRLTACWPTEDTEFPPYGVFRVDKKTPDLLMTPEFEEQPFSDKLSPFVWKKENAVLFEFQTGMEHHFLVEFRDGSTRPKSFQDINPNFELTLDLKETESLGNGVFLSRYEMNVGILH